MEYLVLDVGGSAIKYALMNYTACLISRQFFILFVNFFTDIFLSIHIYGKI